jgi:type IV pilus assembly protein PilY1
MGQASGADVGQFRNGLVPVYAVYLSTNTFQSLADAGAAMEVFAINAATGQKIWQWEQPYMLDYGSATGVTQADNGIPPSATTYNSANGVSAVYAGDQEGRLWEINALTGLSMDNYTSAVIGSDCPSSSTMACKLPVIDANYWGTAAVSGAAVAGPQPITTNLGIARIPTNTGDGGLAVGSYFANYPLNKVAIVGTAGADWVSKSTAGYLHVAVLDAARKDLTTKAGVQAAELQGVLNEQLPDAGTSPFPLQYKADHLYGSISVSGQYAFYEVESGPVDDPMVLSNNIKGATYYIDLGGVTPTSYTPNLLAGTGLANFGGVTIFQIPGSGSINVIGAETGFLTNNQLTAPQALTNSALSVNGSPGDVLYQMLTWTQGYLP